jgi:hypothetical protein
MAGENAARLAALIDALGPWPTAAPADNVGPAQRA